MEIVKQNISQAKRFIRNQNYEDALVVLNKVLSFQPNNIYAKKTKKKLKIKLVVITQPKSHKSSLII